MNTRPHRDLKAKILIIEDEEALRRMASRMLTRMGCQVLTACNGREGIELFQRNWNEIDVVLLDLVMPEVSGRDTFAGLRKIQPNTRVIIASGYSLDGEVQSLLEEGACGFIQKPFLSDDLAKAIADAMAS